MRSSTSPQICTGLVRKRSSVLVIVPSLEFSIATMPKSAVAGLDLLEHLIHGRQRQGAHRMTKMPEHRLLCERALGPEERHLQRLLLRQAGRHDFAEQPHDLLVAQRARIARKREAQHLGLAFRPIIVNV